MPLLTEEQVKKRLASLPGWKRAGKSIRKQFELADFVESMGFVQKVALLAQRADHHPDIELRWNLVTLTLATHSEGGLTERDFKLAAEIEAL